MDRFTKLLDKVFDLLIQCHLPALLKITPMVRENSHWVFPCRKSGNGSCG